MLLNYFVTAFKQLGINKGKSALTMLGVIIGIGSVIFIMTLGEVAKNFLLTEISQFGTNVLEISPTSSFIATNNIDVNFSLDDITALQHSTLLPEMLKVSGVYPYSKSIEYNGKSYNSTIFSTTPDGLSINQFEPQSGRLFTDTDVSTKAKVLVITQKFADDTFGNSASAVNKTVKIAGHSFTIIGVIQDSPFGSIDSGANVTYAPITTIQSLLAPTEDQGKVNFLFLEFANGTDTVSFQQRLQYELGRIKNIPTNTQKPFSVISRAQFIEIFNSILLGIQLFVSAIAGISLVVGGIGIMNIMLVTVKERTKEIGLRKAIGANNQSILMQFLTEAVVLTTLGGIIGITIGLSLSLAAVGIVDFIQPTWSIQFVFVPSAIIISCAVAIITGVVFGLYPAIKASRLHPIEALRYE